MWIESENVKLIINFSNDLLMPVLRFSKSSQFQKLQLFTVSGVDIRAVCKFFPFYLFLIKTFILTQVLFSVLYLVYLGVHALKMFYLALAKNIPDSRP